MTEMFQLKYVALVKAVPSQTLHANCLGNVVNFQT